MIRLVILTLVNISLPFLLWGFKTYAVRVWNRYHKKPLPDYHFPFLRLLFTGVLLLVAVLVISRFFVDTNTEWSVSNPSISQDY
jgi:hypothetical protein